MSPDKPINVTSAIRPIVINDSVISGSNLAFCFPEISMGRGACIKNIEIQVRILK